MFKFKQSQSNNSFKVADETIKHTINNPFPITDVRYTNPNLRI